MGCVWRGGLNDPLDFEGDVAAVAALWKAGDEMNIDEQDAQVCTCGGSCVCGQHTGRWNDAHLVLLRDPVTGHLRPHACIAPCWHELMSAPEATTSVEHTKEG